jgi:uncharacterized Zn-finger protein
VNRTSDASTDSHEHRAAPSTAEVIRDHDCHDRSRVILVRQIRRRALLSALCAGVLSLPLFIAADGLSQSEHSVTSPAAAVPEPTELAGTLHFATFVVEEGREVIATGDLKIVCAGSATVAGVITSHPNVTIEIVAAQSIEITGHIQAGEGGPGVGTRGGGRKGGDVRLEANSVAIRGGQVYAGRGGSASAGGSGGKGGSVFITANLLNADPKSRVRAGDGGAAGMAISPKAGGRFIDAGNGGDAGDLLIDVVQSGGDQGDVPGGVTPVVGCCASGSNGPNGVSWPGANGAPGARGGDGVAIAGRNDGRPGGNGGKGGFGLRFCLTDCRWPEIRIGASRDAARIEARPIRQTEPSLFRG